MRVRTGVLSQMLVDAESAGVDVDTEIERVGLTRADIVSCSRNLPMDPCSLLWRRLIELTGDPMLALRAADRVPFGAFDIVDHLGAQAQTVGGVFAMLARYFRIVNGAIQPRLQPDPDGWCFDAPGTPGPGCEVTFAVTLNRLHRFAGERVHPLRVELSRPRPANVGLYERIFGAGVRFSQGRDALILDEAQFQRPLPGADPGLRALLEAHARALFRAVDAPETLVDRLEREIAATLSSGSTTLASVAPKMGHSARTLQRRLAAEGTDFKAELNRVRLRQAEAHLRDGRLSVTEIAFMLGYGDATAFQRAFRRWTGESVGRWRRDNATR